MYADRCGVGQPSRPYPPHGQPCPWETAYADMYRESWLSAFGWAASWLGEEFNDVTNEAVDVALLRNRASIRQNTAWNIDNMSSEMSIHEFDLADGYLRSIDHRYERLLERIRHADELLERRLADLKRLNGLFWGEDDPRYERRKREAGSRG